MCRQLGSIGYDLCVHVPNVISTLGSAPIISKAVSIRRVQTRNAIDITVIKIRLELMPHRPHGIFLVVGRLGLRRSDNLKTYHQQY